MSESSSPRRFARPATVASVLVLGLVLSGCSWTHVSSLYTPSSPQDIESADDVPLVELLASPDATDRLAAIERFFETSTETVPDELLDLRVDADPRVRAALIVGLAGRGDPDARQWALAALQDADLKVRLAGIEALGKLGDASARQTLEELLTHDVGRTRAAAVSALAEAGAERLVFEAASDSAWQVRATVADALAGYPNQQGIAVASELIHDPSVEVQKRAIASLDAWPTDRSAEILLEAMASPAYMTRRLAAEQLAARWPSAAKFPIDGTAERRAEALESLRQHLRKELGPIDLVTWTTPVVDVGSPAEPAQIETVERLVRRLSESGVTASTRSEAVDSLARFGPDLTAALEALAFERNHPLPEAVYHDILPDREPVFASLVRLESTDVALRRSGAVELVEHTRRRPLSRLALARLVSLAAGEADELVWRELLTAVQGDRREPSIRLACLGVGHRSAEVRRRACEHLAANASRDTCSVEVLLPVLSDTSVPVALAAVRAVGSVGLPDDTGPLVELLRAPNELLRLEAAVVLAQHGDPAGIAALNRLAYSHEDAIRRRTAEAMGRIGSPRLVPSLIRLLDDRHAVRLAALKSLPKAAGRDVVDERGLSSSGLAERIDAWKQWHSTAAQVSTVNGE